MFFLHFVISLVPHPVLGNDFAEPGTSKYVCEGGVNPVFPEMRCKDLGKTKFGTPCCTWHLPSKFTTQETGIGRCLATQEAANEICFCDEWKVEFFGCMSFLSWKAKEPELQAADVPRYGWDLVFPSWIITGCLGMVIIAASFRHCVKKQIWVN
eukprot:gnl/MRDRNA2_/MRDRNA2_179793_c0_seq1.p1 gnl/MRDRNA2_/MRDRNA2_179793_c0~~gnl/MRDRNA2_/MRDRNA2_179793_c0_seq1.p1  ORF type:complete len:154 (+),score=17.29 gnl/MRDRNA2_/MRDRNA2_179793_c0_seq1:80-541(+)